MKKNIILIGGGGHCKSCIDVVETEDEFEIAGIVDNDPKRQRKKVFGYEIIGTDRDLPKLIKQYKNCLITFGMINNARYREAKFEEIKTLGAKFPVIRSPYAVISKNAKIGEGTIVMHRAVIIAGARIGKNCIINTGAIIEHDVAVKDHSHIATGAILNGATQVGKGVFFGSQSRSVQGAKVGDYALIASGVTVLVDVASNEKFYGEKVRR